jgi:hypothetical protein
MSRIRPALALVALVVAACGTGGPTASPTGSPSLAPSATPSSVPSDQPTLAPSVAPTDAPTATPTSAPTDTPSDVPSAIPTASAGASLDPSQSDAGVVGRVTITNDERGGRDGTHDIIAVDADGSDCSQGFSDDFTAIAWYDDAPEEMIHWMSVSVLGTNIPDEDGTTSGITDGRVWIDFASEDFGGTAYSADVEDDPRTSVTIDVTRAADTLVFDFEALTWDGIPFSGQMICSGV